MALTSYRATAIGRLALPRVLHTYTYSVRLATLAQHATTPLHDAVAQTPRGSKNENEDEGVLPPRKIFLFCSVVIYSIEVHTVVSINISNGFEGYTAAPFWCKLNKIKYIKDLTAALARAIVAMS